MEEFQSKRKMSQPSLYTTPAPQYSYRSLKSSEDAYSRLLGMQGELERSNQKIESLIESTLHQIKITSFLSKPRENNNDGARFSFANATQPEIQDNTQQEYSEEMVYKSELMVCQERTNVLENKIKIYESALKSLEEENLSLQKQLAVAQEYKKIYDRILANDVIKQYQQKTADPLIQLQIMSEINAILQKEIAELKVENFENQERKPFAHQSSLQSLDKKLIYICENEVLQQKITELEKQVKQLKETIYQLNLEISRQKIINQHYASQIQKKSKLQPTKNQEL